MPLHRIIHRLAMFLAMGAPPILFLAMMFADLDPKAAADYTALFVVIGLYGICFAPLLAKQGEGIDGREAKLDKICTIWLYTSGIVHLSWELSWCIVYPWLDGVTAADSWAWLWWAYGIADTRYLTGDTFIVPMEWITSLIGGPLAIYAAILLKRGKIVVANVLIIVLSSMEGYGTVLYWTTEWYNGWSSVDMGDFNNWIIKFWGLNSAWVVLPVLSVVVATRAILAELEKAKGVKKAHSEP